MRGHLLLVSLARAQDTLMPLNGQGILNDDDLARLTIPSKNDVLDYLNQNANDYSGGHWTAFSNKYGYCAYDPIGATADPEKRHQPVNEKYACVYGDCNLNKEPFSQRYRICTLPDHPAIQNRGGVDFASKLKAQSTKKLKRLFDFIGGSVDLAASAQDLYESLMAIDFTSFKPARGWPGPSKTCDNTGLKASIKYLSDQWTDTWNGLTFKATTANSLCEFNADTNMFDNCETQLYTSVNVGCDPRVHHLALKIIEANPTFLNNNHLEAIKVAIQIAHYDNNGVLNGVQVTGTVNSGAIIEATFKFTASDHSICQNQCPTPMAWSSWTCHCGTGANNDNLPICCSAERKRFRGCRQPECGFPLSCKDMSDIYDGSQQWEIAEVAPTCNDNLWTENWFTGACSGTPSDRWWSTTTWNKATDIRATNNVNGKQLIIDSWAAAGLLNGDRAAITSFYEDYPSVNLEKLRDLSPSLDTCVGDVRVERSDINTVFLDCVVKELDTAGFKDALDRDIFYQYLVSNLPTDTRNGLPKTNNKFDFWGGFTLDTTSATAAFDSFYAHLATQSGTTFTLDMMPTAKPMFIYQLTQKVITASLNVEYQRFRVGPKFTIDASSVITSADYDNSAYYAHNLQNIYAENFEKGGLGNRQNCNTDGCPTEQCRQPTNYDIDFERRQHSHYRLPDAGDETCDETDHTVCTVIESATDLEENVAYTFDAKQRLQWKLRESKFIDLPVSDEVTGDPNKLMLDLATVVENFFNNFDCPAEIGVEVDNTCPAQALLTPVSLNNDICVASFQETTITKCAAGFLRASLVQDVTGLVDGTGASLALRLYWNKATSEWGKPNTDNYDTSDFDIGTNQPTADYETRYAIFNPTGLAGNDILRLTCRCELPTPIACQNPCQYTEWSTWGSWGQSTGLCLDRTNEQASMAAANVAPTGDQSYPSAGLAFFNARDEFGNIDTNQQNQCFRIFDTKSSFAQLDLVINNRLAEANTIKNTIQSIVSGANIAKLRELKFSLAFIGEWLRDGLYAVTPADANRADEIDVALCDIDKVIDIVSNGDNGCWSDTNDINNVVRKCWVDIVNVVDDMTTFTGFAGTTAATYYYADFVAVLSSAMDGLVLVNPGDESSYNHNKDRYEYITGLGTGDNSRKGSEGWHLDVLKKWLENTNGMKPHGWRFSCRDRNDPIKGYKARYRNYDCDTANPDCCGLIDMVECELPICPDWGQWTPYSTCSKSCIEDNAAIGYGFKARGRTCEADHSLMDAAAGQTGKRRLVIQLPEKVYTGCTCNTDIDAEADAAEKCQTEAHITSTQNMCTFQLAKCNTGKTCPKPASEYTIEKACPACGKPGHVEISKLSCTGPNTGVSTADWESTEAYTDADCDFTTPQMTYADCAITECAANTLELDCINNKRVVIENGEQVEVSCLDIQYSEWSSCPASCKTRSVSKRYRFTNYGEIEEEYCPLSSTPCPAWLEWGAWGSCSNDNLKRRTRTCQALAGLAAVGDECAGDAEQECAC